MIARGGPNNIRDLSRQTATSVRQFLSLPCRGLPEPARGRRPGKTKKTIEILDSPGRPRGGPRAQASMGGSKIVELYRGGPCGPARQVPNRGGTELSRHEERERVPMKRLTAAISAKLADFVAPIFPTQVPQVPRTFFPQAPQGPTEHNGWSRPALKSFCQNLGISKDTARWPP